MITMDKAKAEHTAKDYWLYFNFTWVELANQAYKAGQDDMGEFFDELADDAADVWAGVFGQI